MTNPLFDALLGKQRRGSKPRCHLLTHGVATDVAGRLTALVSPHACIAAEDAWMPQGFTDTAECQLHSASRLLPKDLRDKLAGWWLAPASERAMTPNFDIASTCAIDGKCGLLLVEAKAHDEELIKEAAGRKVGAHPSDDRVKSHANIGRAIEEARVGLGVATGASWTLSRDTHYQMANRFSWAWKVAALGVPVVLVYLGFLNADEMSDRGRPFRTPADWDSLVKSHSSTLFPEAVWNRTWRVDNVPFSPLIRALDVSLG